MLSLTSVLPSELVALILQFYIRDDSDTIIVRAISKNLLELSPRPIKSGGQYRVYVSRLVSSKSLIVWARANRCPWNERTCALAAKGGHLEVLKLLRDNGCPWDTATFSWAARRGHLEVLKWLRANDCPRAGWECSLAAEGGHLEVLKWLREIGCPWNEWWVCRHAIQEGHLEVLNWVRENGCPE